MNPFCDTALILSVLQDGQSSPTISSVITPSRKQAIAVKIISVARFPVSLTEDRTGKPINRIPEKENDIRLQTLRNFLILTPYSFMYGA